LISRSIDDQDKMVVLSTYLSTHVEGIYLQHFVYCFFLMISTKCHDPEVLSCSLQKIYCITWKKGEKSCRVVTVAEIAPVLLMGQKPFPRDYAVIEYSMHHNSPPFSKDHEEIILLEVFFVDSLLSRDPCSRPSTTQLASLGHIPMFLLQSGISVSDESYREVALDALPRTDRMDLALVFVEAIFASNPHFFTSDSAVKFVQNLLASAISKRDRNLTRMLLKVHKTNVTSVAFEAVAKGDVDMVQFLLESGVNVTALNKENETLLHCAALAGHAEISKLLLESGANVHATVKMVLQRSPWSATVLHYAAVGGNPDVVKLLLAAGAEVHDAGLTASNLAALNGHVGVLKVLLSQTTQGFSGVISEDHYDSGWIERYWSTWDIQTRYFRRYVTKWDMYQLPLPFRDVGEDWSTVFNKDSSGTLRISLTVSCHLGKPISCVCFSKDGEYVAAATSKTVMIFETRSGTEIAKLLLDDSPKAFDYGNSKFYKCICFGPSGNRDIITAVDSAVICHVCTGLNCKLPRRSFPPQQSTLPTWFLTPLIPQIHLLQTIRGLGPHIISLWDIGSRTVAARCIGHQIQISSLEVPHVGPTYLVASRDVGRTVKVWDMRSGQALLTLDHGCETMAISPNGKILAMVTLHQRRIRESSVLFFSITTGVLLQEFNVDCGITSLAFSQKGEELITCARSSIRVWEISETGKPVQSRKFGRPWKVISDTVYDDEFPSVAYSSSGSIFTTAHRNTVLFWNIQTPKKGPLAVLRYDMRS